MTVSHRSTLFGGHQLRMHERHTYGGSSDGGYDGRPMVRVLQLWCGTTRYLRGYYTCDTKYTRLQAMTLVESFDLKGVRSIASRCALVRFCKYKYCVKDVPDTFLRVSVAMGIGNSYHSFDAATVVFCRASCRRF